jgi:hypothetical protein
MSQPPEKVVLYYESVLTSKEYMRYVGYHRRSGTREILKALLFSAGSACGYPIQIGSSKVKL